MGCLRLTYWNEVKIPSYRDHKKTTLKTESTPILEMGGKQGSDYQVFGVQMPGRNHQTSEYRYGFN